MPWVTAKKKKKQVGCGIGVRSGINATSFLILLLLVGGLRIALRVEQSQAFVVYQIRRFFLTSLLKLGCQLCESKISDILLYLQI